MKVRVTLHSHSQRPKSSHSTPLECTLHSHISKAKQAIFFSLVMLLRTYTLLEELYGLFASQIIYSTCSRWMMKNNIYMMSLFHIKKKIWEKNYFISKTGAPQKPGAQGFSHFSHCLNPSLKFPFEWYDTLTV